MSFVIPKYDRLASPSILEAHAVDWSLQRNGVELLAGEVTDVDRDTDLQTVRVAGHDWKKTFEGLILPFDPASSANQNYHSGVPSDSTDDVANIVEELVSKVLAGYDNTIDVSFNNQLTGIVTSADFLASDMQDLRSMIDSLANRDQGFEWAILPDKRLVIFAPQKGSVSTLVLDDSNIQSVHHSQQGIVGSILYGRGSGSGSSQLLARRKNPAAQARYRDRVVVTDYGNVSSRSALNAMVTRDIKEVSNQVLEFWVTMRPEGEDVWSAAEDGDTIKVEWDDGDIILDDYFRCKGYESYVNEQGDPEIVFYFDVNDDVESTE
jgi:hypothetical protein